MKTKKPNTPEVPTKSGWESLVGFIGNCDSCKKRINKSDPTYWRYIGKIKTEIRCRECSDK